LVRDPWSVVAATLKPGWQQASEPAMNNPRSK
jgi:hypothetical protein